MPRKESGALNEAMSDIFGACVDRQEGASIRDTWLIGEGAYVGAFNSFLWMTRCLCSNMICLLF